MKILFYPQPFSSSGVPISFGQLFLSELDRNKYDTLNICVAFATNGGTSRICDQLRNFISNSGKVEAYIGIGNDITSAQAIEDLLKAGASVWGFDTGGSVLFHPKVYFLSGAKHAMVSTGSSNLTSEGLFRNFEANNVIWLSPSLKSDKFYLRAMINWFKDLSAYASNCIKIDSATLSKIVTAGRLVDEYTNPAPQRIPQYSKAKTKGKTKPKGISVPPAPTPHPDFARSRPRQQRKKARTPATKPLPISAGTAQYFGMTLSAFDCSHRRNKPGTPEVSIPENGANFFPAVSLQGRKYPDEYFDAILNKQKLGASILKLRVWHRPPGSGTGHADRRINVGNEIIDLTSPGGGDILLFERLPNNSKPQYEVWVVGAKDSNYLAILAKLDQQVSASGQAGTKRYGIF